MKSIAEPRKYESRPSQVEAMQWDGTRANMYRIMAWLEDHGQHIVIKSGYESQGPDTFEITDGTNHHPVGKDYYVVKMGLNFKVMGPTSFEIAYQLAVTVSEAHPSSISEQRDHDLH